MRNVPGAPPDGRLGPVALKSGGGGFDAPQPQPIDPNELYKAQAKYNRVDTYSPFGSGVYSGRNRNRLDITLSPEQQQLLTQQQQAGTAAGDIALGLLGQLPREALSLEGLPALPGVGDFSADRARAEQAYMDRAMGLLDPIFAQQEETLEQGLANRGIPLGAEIRDIEMGNYRRDRGRTLSDIANQAVQAGAAEQSRLFGLSQAARQQGLSERLAERSSPMAEIAALLGQQTVQQPTVSGPTPIDVTGPAQLASNQALGLFGLSQQSRSDSEARDIALWNSLIGAGGGLGAAGLYGWLGG